MTCRWLGRFVLASLLAGCSGSARDPPTSETTSFSRPVDASPVADSATFDSLFAAAEEVYFAGEYDSAAALLSDIRRSAEERGAAAAEARALTWKGLAHWRLGDHAAARRIGEEALAFKLRHKLTDQLTRSYNALGLLAWTENRLSDARRHYEQTIDAATEAGDRLAAASALGNLALVHTELGNFAAARSGFTEMRTAMSELGEARREGNALTNLGMLEIRLGDPRTAVAFLEQALVLYDSVDYGTGTQSALGQLGAAYTELGDPANAFAALDSAMAIAESQGLRQEQASILEAMAEIYRAAGDFTRTLGLYDSAKAINAELGLDIETGVDLRGEADIYAGLGDLARARVSIREALDIHRAAGAPLEELRDLLLAAEIVDRLGDAPGVRRHLREARQLAEELQARIARVELGLTEARIADRHRRSREVLRTVERIQPDLSRGGYTAEWEARLLEARAWERLGEYEQSAAAGRRALATVERVRGNFGSGMLRTAFVADKAQVYAHLVSVLLRLGEVHEAFAVADAARGRVLLEQLAVAGKQTDPSSGSASALSDGELLLREIDRLVESIDYTEEMIPPAERTADQARELASLYDRLERARREYEGVLVQAAETDPNAAALLGGTRTDADAVRAALRPQQLLVEYFVPPEGRVVMFVVSHHGVHALESPIGAQNLASRVRLARDLMARPDARLERSQRVLAGLHDALVVPLISTGALGDADELIIVPHQVLNYLPFAALLDRTTERYLIEDVTLRVLPSAAALPVLARRPSRKDGTRSVFAPFPDRLPATRQEMAAVVAAGGSVERHAGSRATEPAVRRALAGTGLVHVATHGVMNARNPMFSRLELARNDGGSPADDGRLEVHELLTLSIRASLVFLSGCETGIGPARSTAFAAGEDYATLAQALLYAGAGNVIATLWPVEDAGAAVLAGQFYRELGGSPPSLALAKAQRAMLLHERYGSPYHWAAFQLAGLNGAGAHNPARPSVSQE